MTRPSSKLLALAFAGLALGACTARDAARMPSGGPRYASLDATLDARPAAGPGTAAERTATPVAVLPDWIGRPRQLRERDGVDAFEQVISLSPPSRGGGRENLILLRMPRMTEAASGEAGSLTAMGGRPSEAGIRAELAATFPDTAMQVVTRPARNTYGPYGLAVGRSPRGDRCLYAWQWIAEAPALDPAAGASSPLALRVRLCREDVTLEALAAAMNQIKLVARFTGTPVAQGDVACPRSAVPRPRHRSVVHEAAAGARGETRVAPSETMPTTASGPLPAGRRYLGVADAPMGQGEPARDAAPGAAAMRTAFVGAAPMPQAGTITADLPPEALRGPVPRTSGRP